MRRLLLLLTAATLPAAAQNINDPRIPGAGKSDYEREQEERSWKEGEVRLPPAPKAESLIEFFPSSASSFRFFVDAASLTLDRDGVVRYTLVARSAGGHDNVTHEGIRCRSNSFKIYAFGHAGAWSRSSSDWRPIEARTVQRWHNELRSRYFCPVGVPIMTTAEGLDALKRGGHPLASGTGNPERY